MIFQGNAGNLSPPLVVVLYLLVIGFLLDLLRIRRAQLVVVSERQVYMIERGPFGSLNSLRVSYKAPLDTVEVRVGGSAVMGRYLSVDRHKLRFGWGMAAARVDAGGTRIVIGLAEAAKNMVGGRS